MSPFLPSLPAWPHLLLILVLVWNPRATAANAASTDEVIARSSARLERRPADRLALLSLGDALARKGRETGDAAYFERASAVLRQGVSRHPEDSALWRHFAYALSLQHDFTGAVEAARRAVAGAPSDPDAHGVLGDALLELGQYDDAEQCYRLMDSQVSNLASLSRLSGMASLRGQTSRAVALMAQAVSAGQRDREPAESVAWAQWQLGMEQLQTGALGPAQQAFKAALRTFPDYYRAHAGLGAVAAARGQLATARHAYERAMAVVPLPEYAAALAELYLAQGKASEANQQIALIEQLTELGGGAFHREAAYFMLDQGRHGARILAQSEMDLQKRPDVQGHQLHAWALHRNNQHALALQAINRALSLGSRDARLLYQAGVIHLAAGEQARGRKFLREALRVNPRFHLRSAAHARALLASRGA